MKMPLTQLGLALNIDIKIIILLRLKYNETHYKIVVKCYN